MQEIRDEVEKSLADFEAVLDDHLDTETIRRLERIEDNQFRIVLLISFFIFLWAFEKLFPIVAPLFIG